MSNSNYQIITMLMLFFFTGGISGTLYTYYFGVGLSLMKLMMQTSLTLIVMFIILRYIFREEM